MNITTTRKAVKNPEAFSTEELHEALDVLVSDERFTEAQVTKGQAAIEAELQDRGRMTPIPVSEFKDWDYSQPRALNCKNHPELRWYWKGPGRNLHFVWTSAASNDYRECECSINDLQVIGL